MVVVSIAVERKIYKRAQRSDIFHLCAFAASAVDPLRGVNAIAGGHSTGEATIGQDSVRYSHL